MPYGTVGVLRAQTIFLPTWDSHAGCGDSSPQTIFSKRIESSGSVGPCLPGLQCDIVMGRGILSRGRDSTGRARLGGLASRMRCKYNLRVAPVDM